MGLTWGGAPKLNSPGVKTYRPTGLPEGVQLVLRKQTVAKGAGYWECGAHVEGQIRIGWTWEKLRAKQRDTAMREAPEAFARLLRQIAGDQFVQAEVLETSAKKLSKLADAVESETLDTP